MKDLMKRVKQFLQDEEGVTAIEYGLIAALIALVIIVGAGALGTNLNAIFQAIADVIGAHTPAAPATP